MSLARFRQAISSYLSIENSIKSLENLTESEADMFLFHHSIASPSLSYRDIRNIFPRFVPETFSRKAHIFVEKGFYCTKRRGLYELTEGGEQEKSRTLSALKNPTPQSADDYLTIKGERNQSDLTDTEFDLLVFFFFYKRKQIGYYKHIQKDFPNYYPETISRAAQKLKQRGYLTTLLNRGPHYHITEQGRVKLRKLLKKLSIGLQKNETQ